MVKEARFWPGLGLLFPLCMACFWGVEPEEAPTSIPPWLDDLVEYHDVPASYEMSTYDAGLSPSDMPLYRDLAPVVDQSVPLLDMELESDDASMQDALMPGAMDMALPPDPYAGQPYKRRYNVLKDAHGHTVNMILFEDRAGMFSTAADIAPGVVVSSMRDAPLRVCVHGPEQDPWTYKVCYVMPTGELDASYYGVLDPSYNIYYVDAACQQRLGYGLSASSVLGIFFEENDPTPYHLSGPAAGVLPTPAYHVNSGSCEVMRHRSAVNPTYYWHKKPVPAAIVHALPDPPYAVVRE
jgi:hypothetical protein